MGSDVAVRYKSVRTRAGLEKRRLAAGQELLRLGRSGVRKRGTLSRLSKKYGVSRATMTRWKNTVFTERMAGLRSTQAKGKPAKLTNAQKEKLRAMLLEGAMAHGYQTDAWTGKRVAALIEKTFGVQYNWKYVPQLLREQLGFSWQKPRRRPRELDPAKVEAWLKDTWEPAKRGRSPASGPSSSLTKPEPASSP